jgi:hypothetical protein
MLVFCPETKRIDMLVLVLERNLKKKNSLF